MYKSTKFRVARVQIFRRLMIKRLCVVTHRMVYHNGFAQYQEFLTPHFQVFYNANITVRCHFCLLIGVL